MINKHKSNKIKENSNTVRHLNNRTDHRHSKSRCDQSSPARRTMKRSVQIMHKKFFMMMTSSMTSYILTCGYISVCVHIDGFARNCGSSSANTLELPRSCIWPEMFSMYDLVCGCVGVILFIVFACFIYFIVGQ